MLFFLFVKLPIIYALLIYPAAIFGRSADDKIKAADEIKKTKKRARTMKIELIFKHELFIHIILI